MSYSTLYWDGYKIGNRIRHVFGGRTAYTCIRRHLRYTTPNTCICTKGKNLNEEKRDRFQTLTLTNPDPNSGPDVHRLVLSPPNILLPPNDPNYGFVRP